MTSRRSPRSASLALLALLALASCDLRPPYVYLRLELAPAPDAPTAAVASVAAGFSPSTLAAVETDGKAFPLTATVTTDSAGQRELFVEARDASGKALARGRVLADFPKGSQGNATVVLRRACDADAGCDNSRFCDGAATCSGAGLFGFCARAAACGDPPFECVSLTCQEDAAKCVLEVHHDLCPPLADAEGVLQPRYCDPGAGCVAGKSCIEGTACRLSSDPGTARVCLGGECVPSTCGDAVTDPRTEACDDANANPGDGCDACRRTGWAATLVTGKGRAGMDPLKIKMMDPRKLSVGRDGTVYVPDFNASRVWRVGAGLATAAAGTANEGSDLEGIPAGIAATDSPRATEVDGAGNLFYAELANGSWDSRVRRVDAVTGLVATVAGGGQDDGEGVPATYARIRYCLDVGVDGVGNLYVTDAERGLVRRVDAGTGLVHTIAGGGAKSDAAGLPAGKVPALTADLGKPSALAVASPGILYVAARCAVWRLTLDDPADPASGQLEIVAGNGACASTGDGVPALQAAVDPSDLALGPGGDLYFSDWTMKAVRRVRWAAGGAGVSTVAGNGSAGTSVPGPALASPIDQPAGLAFGADGSLYVAEAKWAMVLRIARPADDPGGWTLERLAGGSTDEVEVTAGPATALPSTSLAGLAYRDHHVYYGDGRRNRVWSVDLTDAEDPLAWKVSPAAGGGAQPADHVAATSARLELDGALALGASGELLVASDRQVRRVFLDPLDARYGLIETVAGDGSTTATGDGGPALLAGLGDLVWGLAAHPDGRIFVSAANRVRQVAPVDPADPATWTIAAAAGTGADGYTGDGGPAALAEFSDTAGVAVAGGRLFVADSFNAVVRAADLGGAPGSGSIFTAAGGGPGFPGPSGLATQAELGMPMGLTADATGRHLFVSDAFLDQVLLMDVSSSEPSAWTLEALASSATSGSGCSFGDGGPVGASKLCGPLDMAVGEGGELYVATAYSVRRIVFGDPVDRAKWTIDTVVGGVDPPGDGPVETGALGTPAALARLDDDRWAVADGPNGRVRLVDLAKGQVRTIAGYPNGADDRPGAAGSARFSRLLVDPEGIAWDVQSKSLFVSEAGAGLIRRIRVTDLAKPWAWTIEAFAGGKPGHADGTLAQGRFFGPAGLAFDAVSRTLYVAEESNHDVRAIRVDAPTDPACVTTVAGTPANYGFFDGAAAKALFNGPTALALGAGGTLFVADTRNHRVRRVDLAAATVATVAGNGAPSSTGEGSPAHSFPVDTPRGLALDAEGNLFVSSRDSVRVVAGGAIGTVYGPATDSPLTRVSRCLTGVAVADAGGAVVYALDQCQGLLLRLDRSQQDYTPPP